MDERGELLQLSVVCGGVTGIPTDHFLTIDIFVFAGKLGRMKNIKDYSNEVYANFDREILEKHGVKSVVNGSDSGNIGDSLQRHIQLMVVDDQDYERALRILEGQNESQREPSLDVIEDNRYEKLAVVGLRILAIYLFLEGIVYLTYILENMTRISDGTIQVNVANVYRNRVIWEIVRISCNWGGAVFLVYYADSIARVVGWGLGGKKCKERRSV